MANTNYDQIYSVFVDNCGVDTSTLPSDDEGKYKIIRNGARHYNTKVDDGETKLVCDDDTESINIELDDTRLLILAFCMKYTQLENELVKFEQIWQPFTKEMGQKFYGEQIKGRESTLERVERKIIELLTDLDSGSIMD